MRRGIAALVHISSATAATARASTAKAWAARPGRTGMTPGRGVGANTALRDAALLSRQLRLARRFVDDFYSYRGEED